jgi:hypothetical protein
MLSVGEAGRAAVGELNRTVPRPSDLHLAE